MLYYFGYTSTEYVCMAVENQPHVTIPKWPKEAHTVRQSSKKKSSLRRNKQCLQKKRKMEHRSPCVSEIEVMI